MGPLATPRSPEFSEHSQVQDLGARRYVIRRHVGHAMLRLPTRYYDSSSGLLVVYGQRLQVDNVATSVAVLGYRH